MSTDRESPVRSPTGAGAESPTTVRPLDMDDDDVQDSIGLTNETPLQTAARVGSSGQTTEEAPPPKPPRPLSPQQQAENTLKEAFPSIDAAVVKAVLMASGGRVEPAFNALLGMSDPDAVTEPLPPPQPPRPNNNRTGSTLQSQVEADEMYARQLAEHYDGTGQYGRRTSSRGAQSHGQRGRQQTGLNPNELQDENHSFLEDDLPVIKENLRKGFLETQKQVNGWITNLKKRIDGEEEERGPGQGGSSQDYRGGSSQYGSRRGGDAGRRSADHNRYDADPQVLGDDFAGIQLQDDGTPAPAQRSTRPLANPDLFKPTPSTPKPSDGRKVSFQNGPPEDMDLYRISPKAGAKDAATSSSNKQSKWQPMSAVEPSPVGEGDNDPFSLGDSEDEKESKDRVGGKEIKMEDTDRLKRAAAEAMAEDIGEMARKPEPAETVGTRDKVAEELTRKT